jgi:MraZ protein
VESFFSGNATIELDSAGRLTLPLFILSTLARRRSETELLLGWHETDPCLVGQDSGLQVRLFVDLERRRRREERLGAPVIAHHRRARITFGSMAAERIDARGRVRLPESLRRRAELEEQVLIVGTGPRFEIWSLEQARWGRDRSLRELAAWHCPFASDPDQKELAL